MADATQQLNSEYEAMEILSVLVLSCALWAVDAYPYYPYYGNMDSCKFFFEFTIWRLFRVRSGRQILKEVETVFSIYSTAEQGPSL